MSKRNTQTRRRNISSIVREKGRISVDFLASHFKTSHVTIRKDLAELEANGLLLRRHGGAMSIPSEMAGDHGTDASLKRKQALALTASELVRDHNRVIIDSGSSTAALLPLLRSKVGLVVMTNSLDAAMVLRELENEPTILMTGGTWDASSESFQGQLAEQMLKEYDFDQLFVGADGIDIDRGTTTYNELYSLSRVMAHVSREVVVMAESGKIKRRIHNLEIPWSLVDVLVTDDHIDPDDKSCIESKSVHVMCASTEKN